MTKIPKLRSWILACIVIASVLVPCLAAQGTREDYERAQQFLPGNLRHVFYLADVNPHWIQKTSRFWYRKAYPNGSEFILVDAEKNTSAPAFDHARLATALSQADKREHSAPDLPFREFEFVEDGKAIHFSIESTGWNCSLTNYECKTTPAEASRSNEELSPNKRWAAFVRDHNLFLRDVSTGTELQLTHDGEKGWDYATPLPSLRLMVDQGTEDVKQPAAVFWAPDSSRLVTYRIDSRNSGRFTSLQFVPPNQLRPKAFTYVYPLPGEVLAKAQPILFDVQSGRRIDVNSSIELPFQDGPGFEWLPDSKGFFYDWDERGYKAKELRVIDASTGEQKVLMREQADPYLDPGETFYRFVKATGEFLWSSERDGWNHLYLYSKTGQLENQITQGHWVVVQIEYIDEPNRRVYSRPADARRMKIRTRRICTVVGFDGKGLQLLTPENANHSVNFSPDGAYLYRRCVATRLPTKVVLRHAKDGSEAKVLEESDPAPLAKMGWKAPESFRGKATDGTTDLYGLIWRPSNFDSAKKYPIVEFVYTGPQSFFVPKTFNTFWLQSVAELGFVVVMVDGRGTSADRAHFISFPTIISADRLRITLP